MQAFILGCSHAAGSEMWHEPGFAISDVVIREEYGYLNSYPAVIAASLGYEIVNHAIPGGSNDAMYRIFCNLEVTDQDLVIACWTGPERTEIWCDTDYQWVQICGGVAAANKKIANSVALQGLSTPETMQHATLFHQFAKIWTALHSDSLLNKIKNIEALNAKAKFKNVRVLNFNSFGKLDPVHDGHWPLAQSFCNWAHDLQMPCTSMGHFFQQAHLEYAQMALTNIDKKFFANYNKRV